MRRLVRRNARHNKLQDAESPHRPAPLNRSSHQDEKIAKYHGERGAFERTVSKMGVHALRAHEVTFPEPLKLIHAEYTIKLTTKGRGAPIRYRGSDHAPCSVGKVTVLEPFEPVVSRKCASVTSFVTLLIEPHIVRGASDALGQLSRLCLGDPHIGDRVLAQEVAALGQEIAAGVPLAALDGHVASLLELLLGAGGSDRPVSAHNAVLRAREFILDRLAESLSLGDLEWACGLSRFHLTRLFRCHFGMPPHEFHTRARIALARTLLVKGRSQAEAAQEVGFFDQSHLHRHFRRIVGMSPGAFQHSVRT